MRTENLGTIPGREDGPSEGDPIAIIGFEIVAVLASFQGQGQRGGPCGVNPVTGTPGIATSPLNRPGNLRSDRAGSGRFQASRDGGRRTHAGLDIAGRLNASPVVASRGGRIIHIGPRGAYGNMVTIDHGNGITSRYGHLQMGSINAAGITRRGHWVVQGQRIGTVGNTGNARGAVPHVHFETRRNGVPTRPYNFITRLC